MREDGTLKYIDFKVFPARGREKNAVVVFVHGMYHAKWCWKRFRVLFAKGGYKSYAISLRGHGRSEGSLWRASLGDYAQDVLQKVRALDRPVIFVAHSMGALVVARVVETFHPAAVVLLAPASPLSLRGVIGRVTCHYLKLGFRALLKGKLRAVFPTLREVVQYLFFSPQMPDAEFQKYFANLGCESLVASLQMLIGWAARCPTYRRLANTTVIILGAKNDVSVAESAVRYVAERMGVEPEMVPDLAHDVMLDCNRERAAQQILRDLKRALPDGD
jgi:alpha-beta hydrolase superfamily lysophospholipase